MGVSSAFAVVIALAGAAPAVAAEPQTPAAFLAWLYAPPFRYDLDGAPGRIFDPSTAAMLRRAEAAYRNADDVGLDYDPICGCQDRGGFRPKVVSIRTTGPDQANAVVRTWPARRAESEQVQTLELVRTPQGWRIHDIRSTETASFRAELDQLLKDAPTPRR